MMKNFIIFDIDGTLADISQRLHFIQGEKKDWESFYGAMDKDQPIYEMALLLRVLLFTTLTDTEYEVVFVTGRPEKYREKTMKWLSNISRIENLNERLFMRKDGDHRQDYVVKREIVEKLKERGPIRMAFEDRDQVVQMYRSLGIRCLQVVDGDY